jgi:hypothetical protein
MAPLICWSFSNSMFRYLLVDHAVPAFAHAEGDYERAESKLRAKATMLSGRQV